jgi:thiamine-monophosphate kinase
MKVRSLGEFGLIEQIRKAAPQGRGVRAGIGDDAAWLECRGGALLVTTDLLIEGIHFDLRWTSFYALGYKTLAVNLSDIAAMGGVPDYATLSLAVPGNYRAEDIKEFYRGLNALARRSGVSLVGGDTSAGDRMFISPALMGHCDGRPVLRSGARPGDDLWATGSLGDSALGLALLKKKIRTSRAQKAAAAYAIRRHRFPTARLAAGALLGRTRLAKAMIDLSDGLVQDLGHICKASGVGAEIDESVLPLSQAYRSLAGGDTTAALGGGEDYEMLFAARARDRNRIEKLRPRLGIRLTRIGHCVRGGGVKVLYGGGRPRTVSLRGYNHFKSAS